MANLPITVTATDKSASVLQRVKQNVAGLDNAAGKASGGLSALGKAAGVAGIVALGVQVGQAALEMAKLGAQSLALKSSFEQVQGGAANAASVLDALRDASRGMISDYDLMLSANKAALLGVADTAQEMSSLLQIASVRGRAMGISATQAFSDIVTGLGRMSPLLLDNLGITVNLEDTMKRYADSLGKTSDALTDTERKQALVNAVIESSASLMEDANKSAETLAGQGFAQLDTAWGNFKTAIGESLAPFFDARAKEAAAGVQAITDAIVDAELNQAKATIAQQVQELRKMAQDEIVISVAPGAPAFPDDLQGGAMSQDAQRLELVLFAIQQIEQAQKDNISGAEQWGDQITRIAQRVVQFGTVSDTSLRQVAILLGNIATTTAEEKLQQTANAMGALSDATRPTAEAIAATNASLGNSTQSVDSFTKSFDEAARILEEAEPKLKGIYDTLLDTGDIEGASKAYGQIQGIIQEITAEWIRAGVPIEEIESTLLPKLLSELDTLIGKQVDAGAAGITAGADMSSGFLSAIPAIQLVIQAVGALIGAAGEASAAVGRATQTGVTSNRLKGRRPSVGFADGDPFAIAPSMGRTQSDGGAAMGVMGGVAGLMRKLPFERMQPLGIAGGLGDALGGGSGGGGGGSVDNTLNQLAGKIKSVLSGALKSGIDLSSILPREDAVEEPARRLADIAVRGFESPWTEYIRNTFPEIWAQLSSSGDPKAAAAGILRDFEAGLRPELLDKGRAKELVKRALLGDANMTQLANEIAAELSAEMGISMEQAQAAAASALGTGTGTGGVGASFGDGVVTGVKDGNVGGRAVAALVTQLEVKDNLTAVYNAGQSHGAQYGSGFLATVGSNLPGGLIAILVAAVSPGVLANVNAQSGRTGATGADGSAGGAI